MITSPIDSIRRAIGTVSRSSVLQFCLATALALTYLALVRVYWGQINDDAFITFRYSKFLATGAGPYYNVGEHVEGYTNFLLMLLLSGVIRCFGEDNVLIGAKWIGVGAGLASVWIAWALASDLLRRNERIAAAADWIGACAGLIVATDCAFAVNSTTGLETTLFAACISAGIYLAQGASGRFWNGAGIAFGLAALTRPEGALLFVLACVGRGLAGELRAPPGRRALLTDVLVVSLVISTHTILRYWLYDGEILPNTYFAKMGGFDWRFSSWGYVWGFAATHLGGIAAAIALLPLLGPEGLRRAALPSVLLVAWGLASVFVTGTDWMIAYRLLVPYLPLWAALAVAGISVVGVRSTSRPVASTAFAACALAVALFLVQINTAGFYQWYCQLRRVGYIEGHHAAAQWINERGQPGQSIALMDIGIVGYRCFGFNVLDITGLTDRYIAKSPGPFLRKDFDPNYILKQQPQFIVISYALPADAVLPKDLERLQPWTDIEERIVQHPEFAAHYTRRRPAGANGDELDLLAASLGAEAAFRHRHPGPQLFLLIYEHHT
ncbi:MAG: hypothetical protein HY270_01730 [Deltaproteobacteria bacterium]|nr:hypothetical protein [Deltaproteobacteria bacterium]